MDFEAIGLDRQAQYRQILLTCPQITSDYSFANIWGWQHEHSLQWAWDDNGLVWIRQLQPRLHYWAPIGPWDQVDWASICDRQVSSGTRFVRVPEKLKQIWTTQLPGRLHFEEARGQWDYLYSRKELVLLKGNRFHKKKNLLNQFVRKYEHSYRQLRGDILDMALSMQENWCQWRDCEASDSLAAENRVIEKILHHWEHMQGLSGGALIVDQQMVAYTVVEALDDRTLLIHFEKADPQYKGAYQAINQIFLSHADDRYEIVNREQDLGDEGLRKAKLSYHPIDFQRKWTLKVC